MIRIAAALLLACLPTAAQDEEALARGQKYLDKIARSWDGKLPQERLCGVYLGRQWVGTLTLTVKAAPAGSGAAYEVATRGEMAAAGHSTTVEGRALLGKNLAPVSSDSTEKTDGKVERKTITVANGRWKLKTDDDGKVTEKEGPLTPGVTCDAAFLPLFSLPDDAELTILSVDSKKGVYHLKKLAGKRDRTFDGNKMACSVLEMGHPEKAADLWFVSPEGKGLELQAGDSPVRVRPITEAQKGKPIDEPLELKAYERALIDLFLAIKKNDAAAVRASFDFHGLALEMIPGFAGVTDEQKKEAVQAMRDQMEKNLLSEQMRAQLPDAGLLEEAIAGGMKSSEKDGLARVQVFGKQVWKLALAKEGDRKGKWLIIGIAQEE